MKFSYLTAAVFVATLLALGTVRMLELEDRNHALEQQLRDSMLRQSPKPVQVTCVCPEYDEGWDDAAYVSGCDPEELDIDVLQTMCAELETYGYVPHC